MDICPPIPDSWRLALTTIAIAWFITDDVETALQIGFIEIFAKIAIYYVHERVWVRIRLGIPKAE